MRLNVFLFLVACFSSGSALAGFQWVPPTDNPTAPSVTASESPSPLRQQDIVQKIYDAQKHTNTAIAAPQPVHITDAIAPQKKNTPAIRSNIVINPTPIATSQASLRKPINGFGDHLPLAIALSEIVPPGFSYAFASGVNAGLPVSWEGQGQPWPRVVSSMLTPHGITAYLRGNILIISMVQKKIQTRHQKQNVPDAKVPLATPNDAPTALIPMLGQ